MALKDLLKGKNESYLIKRIDKLLMQKPLKDAERRWDINSPSMASKCSRSIYYSRIGVEQDAGAVDPRLQRIFDNGTGVHERLQEYLGDEGILLMDEVPVYLKELQVQGHTDGILALNKHELGVLEIKSINTHSFSSLVDAKPEHKVQAQIYMMCLEAERLRIKELCKNKKELRSYLKSEECHNYYASMYSHLLEGAKFTRQEKIDFKVFQHQLACRMLWRTARPINKMVFLYEDKNTQELKEFTVKWDKQLVSDITNKLTEVNKDIKAKKMPNREGTSKSCTVCRWCNFKEECWM